MGAFDTMLKLKKFLSKRNLELLEIVLSLLVDPKSDAFNSFWRAFMLARGGSLDDVTYTTVKLGQLREILREYLGGLR